MVKLGREEPVASMDASGKIIWARHNEVQTVNVKSLGDSEEVRGHRPVCTLALLARVGQTVGKEARAQEARKTCRRLCLRNREGVALCRSLPGSRRRA